MDLSNLVPPRDYKKPQLYYTVKEQLFGGGRPEANPSMPKENIIKFNSRRAKNFDFVTTNLMKMRIERTEEIKRRSFKITKLNFIESQKAKLKRSELKSHLKAKRTKVKRKPRKNRKRKNLKGKAQVKSQKSKEEKMSSKPEMEMALIEDLLDEDNNGIVEFPNAVRLSSPIKANMKQLDIERGFKESSKRKRMKRSNSRSNHKGMRRSSGRTKNTMRRRRMIYSSKLRRRVLSTIQEAREENEECSVDTSCISFSKNEEYHFNRSTDKDLVT